MPTLAAPAADLTSDLCRQFTHLTGWRLRYAEVRHEAGSLQEQLEQDEACRWYAPIRDGQRIAGFLSLFVPRPGEDRVDFSEAIRWAESLAALLGKLVETSAELSARNRDVATLLNLGLAIPAQNDLAFAMSQLLKAGTHLTNSRCAAFFLLDGTTSHLKLRAVYQLSRNDVPVPYRELRRSAPDLKALADSPVLLRSETGARHPLVPENMRRAMVVGVASEHIPFGTLWVYERRARDHSVRDQHVLQSIAAQIAAVLDRSALVRGHELQERLCRDVRVASKSHNDSNLQELPVDPRFDLAARCTSCFELGGDLCEVIPLTPDRTAIAIGDASGNSIPAAMIMSAVRGAVCTHAADEGEVAEHVSRVNKGLCSIARSSQFMSLCYGVFDAAGRRFTYCNAGHPAPLLIRDKEVQPLESHGLLLGVMAEARYRHASIELREGDLLVFYSDGISEARNADEQLFRGEGIAAAVARASSGSADQILNSIWDSVDKYMATGDPADDRTVLVLRVN
jgi:sigma-B regulation protein RsbU (phosphoserine phosphatase)